MKFFRRKGKGYRAEIVISIEYIKEGDDIQYQAYIDTLAGPITKTPIEAARAVMRVWIEQTNGIKNG